MAENKVTLGENLDATLIGSILTVKIDLSKRLRPSKSGKNAVIATTSGNQSVAVGNQIVKIGINAYGQ